MNKKELAGQQARFSITRNPSTYEFLLHDEADSDVTEIIISDTASMGEVLQLIGEKAENVQAEEVIVSIPVTASVTALTSDISLPKVTHSASLLESRIELDEYGNPDHGLNVDVAHRFASFYDIAIKLARDTQLAFFVFTIAQTAIRQLEKPLTSKK